MEINELNKLLLEKLSNRLKQSEETLKQMDSAYSEVIEVKQRLLNYDLKQFKINVEDRIKNKLIEEWEKYSTRGNVSAYDMIYFEYNSESYELTQAYSYGIYDIKNYKLSIEDYYMGDEYKYNKDWYAGEGLILEPFKTTEAMDYSRVGDSNRHDLISYLDPESGRDEIWSYIHDICNYVLHNSFKNADEKGLLDSIKLKSGGFFSYNEHDYGLSMPFYIKK
ncbi:MAG: hypothetical protein AAGA77_01190 [Bacteroidota bacterium]